MKRKERMICGLDVGTWKTCIIIARADEKGELEVLHSGLCRSSGLAKGMVVDHSEVVKSIRLALDAVESKSDITVNHVVAGISGSHIRSRNLQGTVQVQGKHSEVTAKDVENVIRAAQSSLISEDCDLIHILPLEFVVNNQRGIKNPVGMSGTRLDIRLHIISCDGAHCQSLINAANKAKIGVERIILQSIASGEAVLTDDEKEFGAVVVDIGSGTTDIAVFFNNTVCFASVIPVGGEHFTMDLVAALHISREEAEKIKIEYGSVLPEQVMPDEKVAGKRLGTEETYEYPREELCGYLYCRGAELLEFVRDAIRQCGIGYRHLSNVVFTGGGSMMGGMLELAESILEMPVRQGFPRGFPGLEEDLLHPMYASAVGLAILEAKKAAFNDFLTKTPLSRSWIEKFMGWLER